MGLMILTGHGIEDAEGSTTSVFNVSDTTSMAAWNLEGAHTKDDFTVTPYANVDGDLWLAYRRPGDSWSHVEIADRNYLSSTTDWKTGGCLVTSNNSVVVYASFSPSGAQTSCFWISFGDQNFTDPWEYQLVATATYALAFNFDINGTDHICILARTGSALYAGVYDFQDDNMDHSLALWYSAINPFGEVVANKTGVFWIAYGPGASTTPGSVRDYYKAESAISFTTGYQQHIVDMVCLDNDLFMITWIYKFSSSWCYPYVSIQGIHGGGFWQRRLDNALSISWGSPPVISLAQNSTIAHIACYQYTDTVVNKWTAAWDADESTWQASMVILFTDSDGHIIAGGFNRIWPRFNDTSVSQPTTGWVFTFHEDINTPEFVDTLFLNYDDLNWTGDMTAGDNGGNNGGGNENGGSGPYNPGGGGGGAPHVSFTYQDTNWGIKFTPVHPTIHQVVSYKWLFGDGSSSTRRDPTHWYRNPGEYIVTLEIKFFTGVISRKSQGITVNEFSDLQYLFQMIQRDEDRVYIKFGYYEVIFTELSLVISGMLAFVAVAVSLHDRKKYHRRFKEGTATVLLRMVGIIWVGIAIILLIWIRMGGI